MNGDWSVIYKAWHYRFKQEVWFPYKLSLGKQGYSFLIKTENRAEYRSNETKHSRAQPSLMTTGNVVPATEAVQDVMTTDNVVPATEAVQIMEEWLEASKHLFDCMCYFNGTWDYLRKTCN